MKLREVAHTRAGDKGNTSNLSVIFFNASDYEKLASVLDEALILEHVSKLFSGTCDSRGIQVRRYELPCIHGLNFVVSGLLRGGVTRSLSLDTHGKTLSSILLALDL